MKIAIIDPVVGSSADELNREIAYLKEHLDESTEVEHVLISEGFTSVETVTQDTINGARIIEKVYEIQGKGFDGIFVNCFNDPGVLGAREISDIPVMGPYVPSIHYAATISEKVAIITTDDYGIICEKRKAASHGLSDIVDTITKVDLTVSELSDDSLITRIVENCRNLEIEGINAAVLGCTGMNYVADEVRRKLAEEGIRVNLVEPMKVGIKMLELAVALSDSNTIKSTEIDFNDYRRK